MIRNSIVIGPVNLHLYGLMIGLGVVLGIEMAIRFLKKSVFVKPEAVIEENDVWGGVWWALSFGLVGARLYHVVDLWDYYSTHSTEILAVWNGGLGIFGGIVGGAVGLGLYVRFIKKGGQEKLLSFLDVSSVGLFIGQAVGRLGNFFNQELYGKPTDLPWAIFIESHNRVAGVERESSFHPLFFYEALWNASGFFFVWFLLHQRLGWRVGSGLYFATYLMWYSLGRFLLEYLRIDPWQVHFLGLQVATAQLVALGLFLLGLIWIGVVRLGWYGEET